MYRDTFTLSPCGTLAFAYDGDWRPVDDQPSFDPGDAAAVPFKVVPNIENSIGHVEVIVTSSGTSFHYEGEPVPTLPPCEGAPPAPSESPS